MASLLNSYETTLQVNSFGGFYQASEDTDVAMKYAVAGENFSVRGGLLRSMEDGVVHVEASLDAPIGTLMILYRRWSRDEYAYPEANAILIATAGGNIYARPVNASKDEAWRKIYSGITNDHFDYVCYETSEYWTANGLRVDPKTDGAAHTETENPIDVLIMTNADDGMFVIYGDTLFVMPFTVKASGGTEKRFGVLTRHAERIWGAAIKDEPDMLMYSTPYEPLNWEQDDAYPEDGAGDIQQPSWDGDGFVALRTYGSYLLAIKKNRIWRVTGTNPGEYYFKEQFGGGTIVEDTVVVVDDYMFLLSYDGLMMYDGTAVQPFRQQYVKDIMRRVNQAHIDQAVAVMRGQVYCLALPMDGSDVNNAILEYDMQEHSFTLRMGVYVSSFLQHENILLYTDSRETHAGAIMRLDGNGTALPMRYITAYQDMGYKSITKSGFEVYLCSSVDMPMTIGIRTEKKLKTRKIALKAGKAKRVRLNVAGRRFRLELESEANAKSWYMPGGFQINMELDAD